MSDCMTSNTCAALGELRDAWVQSKLHERRSLTFTQTLGRDR